MEKSMDKYTIIELEAHANCLVLGYFHSLVHPTITSILTKFKTFFPPKLPKDETCIEKMCFCAMGLKKNYKCIIHKCLNLEYSVVV